MRVDEMMTTHVETCHMDHDLTVPARIMWDQDCGCVAVVGGDGKVVGMITDRDVCMAAYTQGRPLSEIPVYVAAAHKVFSCRPDDSLEAAEEIMRKAQVRRLPVTDADGRLLGMLSLGDLARRVTAGAPKKGNGLSADSIAGTLAAISKSPTLAVPAHA